MPFSECNERLPFFAIQRPSGANVILLAQQTKVPLTGGGFRGWVTHWTFATKAKVPLTGGGFRGWVTHFDLQKNCGARRPRKFLVNQIVFLAGETRERRSCAYDVASFGYNLKNINLWSRIAQNCLFHNLQHFLSLNYSV